MLCNTFSYFSGLVLQTTPIDEVLLRLCVGLALSRRLHVWNMNLSNVYSVLVSSWWLTHYAICCQHCVNKILYGVMLGIQNFSQFINIQILNKITSLSNKSITHIMFIIYHSQQITLVIKKKKKTKQKNKRKLR